MSLKKLVNKYLGSRKKKEEEPEVPKDWATRPQEPELEPEASVWPPVEVKRRKRFVLGDRKIKGAKAMFVVYVLLAVGTIRAAPWILVLFIPTILLIMDYIRCNETLKAMGAWSEVEENKRDLDNIASVE